MISHQVFQQIIQTAALLNDRGFYCAWLFEETNGAPSFPVSVHRTRRDLDGPLFSIAGTTADQASRALEMMRDILNQPPTIEP